MKQKCLLIFFIFWTLCTHSQSVKADSLLAVLKNCENDTLKVNVLNGLSEINVDYGFIPKATDYAQQALKLSQKLNFQKGVVDATIQIGSIAYFSDNLSESFQHFIDALKLAELVNYGYGTGLAKVYLGRICDRRNDKVTAKKYFSEAIQILESIQSKKGLCYAYNWKGGLFENYQQSIEEFKIANRLAIETNNVEMQARTIVNAGVGYRELKMFVHSDSCYQVGFKLFEAIGNKDRLEWVISLIGENFYREGHYQKALLYTLKAAELCKEIGGNKVDYDNTFNISEIYSKLHKYDSAFYYRVKYEAELDSSKNGESMRKIKELELQYLFDKQQEKEKAEQVTKENRQRQIRNLFIWGFALVLFFALVFLKQRNRIKREKHKSDALLENILPEEVAHELKTKGSTDAKHFDEVTILFTDFKDFTQISEKMTPGELVDEIHNCFKAFDLIIEKHGIEKIKTIGDSYMCAGGLPVPNKTHAVDVLNAALEILQFIEHRAESRIAVGKEPFQIRIGIHTGPVVAGIVGIKKFAYDIWGDTVNTASRMESSSEAGKINISETTYEKVKEYFNCNYRGKIQAKGKGEIDMYFVEGRI